MTKRVVVLFLRLGFLDAWIHSFSHNDLIVQIVKVQRNVEESVGFKNPLWISLERETARALDDEPDL